MFPDVVGVNSKQITKVGLVFLGFRSCVCDKHHSQVSLRYHVQSLIKSSGYLRRRRDKEGVGGVAEQRCDGRNSTVMQESRGVARISPEDGGILAISLVEVQSDPVCGARFHGNSSKKLWRCFTFALDGWVICLLRVPSRTRVCRRVIPSLHCGPHI